MQRSKSWGFLIQTAYQRTVLVPLQRKRTVPTYRTSTITKKTYRSSLPHFLAKIEAYRIVPYCTAILGKDLFCLFWSAFGQGMVWNGIKDDFSIIYTGIFLSIPFPFHTKNLPFYTKIFHILFHSSVPKKLFDWKQCNEYFAHLQCSKQPLVKVREIIQRCSNRHLV